jgi:hypothetical protein
MNIHIGHLIEFWIQEFCGLSSVFWKDWLHEIGVLLINKNI